MAERQHLGYTAQVKLIYNVSTPGAKITLTKKPELTFPVINCRGLHFKPVGEVVA